MYEHIITTEDVVTTVTQILTEKTIFDRSLYFLK